jgi:AcrR family transcriptional regulator
MKPFPGNQQDLDPRAVRTRRIVLDAARELIVAEGQEVVTPTRLASDTGISRSTIYRQWPDPDDIVLEAIASDTAQAPFEPTGDIREDLTRYLQLLRSGLELPHTKILAARIDRAEHDVDTAEMIRAMAGGRRALTAGIVDDSDNEFMEEHALIVGPLFYQRFLAREEITDDFIAYVVDAYLAMRVLRS